MRRLMAAQTRRNRMFRHGVEIYMRRLLALVLCLALAGNVFGQPPASANEKSDFAVTTKLVIVPVTVAQRDGTIVNGLTPKDFRLFDNKKPQQITEDIVSHPLSVVIAIQADAKTEKVLPLIQKTASLIQARLLGDEGEAAVLSFDHRIQTLTDFTSDVNKLSDALKKLKPGSTQSRLNDASIEGVRLLKSRPVSRRRALILIAESRDNGSELKAREVLSEAEFANVIIYSVNVTTLVALGTAAPSAQRSVLDNRPPGAVHLPGGMVETPTTQSQGNTGNFAPIINEIYLAAKSIFVKNPLEVYTTYSGGREFSFATQRDLDRALSNIAEELHSQYLLTYSPNNMEEAGFHNIVVQVARPDLKIRARDGYYIAGKSQ